MWAAVLHKAMPFATFFICPALIVFVIYLWISSHLSRQKEALEREKRHRQEIAKIAGNFRSLNTRFLTNKSSEVFCFESEIDAELAASKIGGQYFEYRKGYIVITQPLANDKLITCKSFLSEALSEYPRDWSSNIPRLALTLKPESEVAERIRNERVAKLRSERDKIKASLLSDIETRDRADLTDGATAVYVFASSTACKVGISNHPKKRLQQIQTGHPALLRIAKVWWFTNIEEASQIERQAHGLLKVLGAHASGEWFSAKPKVVIEQVRRAISDLTPTPNVDRSLQILGDKAVSEFDITLAKLANLPWKISRKGNEWLQFADHHIVVFKSRGGYSFRYKDKFSDEKFVTKADAKAAALHSLLTTVNGNCLITPNTTLE
jgi:hypothetical protein